jgi:hypothetical protein
VNASYALVSYLEDGGSLFLSGQDVAYYDDYFPHIHASYFRDYLKARYVRDDTGISDLAGQTGGLFEGLAFSQWSATSMTVPRGKRWACPSPTGQSTYPTAWKPSPAPWFARRSLAAPSPG